MIVLFLAAFFEIEAPGKPLARADIEDIMMVELPRYRVMDFNSIYSDYGRIDVGQTLKLKGNTEKFYNDLDALCAEPNRPCGLQWYRTEDGYELPGIGRGGLVKVNRAKNTVYISTTVAYE